MVAAEDIAARGEVIVTDITARTARMRARREMTRRSRLAKTRRRRRAATRLAKRGRMAAGTGAGVARRDAATDVCFVINFCAQPIMCE